MVETKKVIVSAVVVRVLGVTTAKLAPEWGAALPTLALTFVLARGSRARSGPATGERALSPAA